MGFLGKLFKKKRVVLIGLDGVPFSLLKELIDEGHLPFLKKKFKEGTFKEIKAPLPEISSVSWSTFMSGRNPAEHGIFGFTLIDRNYNIYFSNFNHLKSVPIWEKLGRKGKRSVVINLPSTYPVKEMNGVLISGFVSPDIRRAVYPVSLLPYLKKIDYRIDVDNSKGKDRKDEFLDELFYTLERRFILSKKLASEVSWDFFMVVVTGTDRLHHFLFKSFKDKNSKYHQKFIEYYKKIDSLIQNFLGSIDENYRLIMLSDHGFTGLYREVYVNNILFENGFLKFKDGERSFENIDFDKTICFALDPSRIYLNLKGKFKRGIVSEDEREVIIQKLIELFGKLNFEGKKVIEEIYRKEEIYSGKYLFEAPDMVLKPVDGFDLKASFRSDKIISHSHFQGMHTRDNAFFFSDIKDVDVNNIGEVVDVSNFVLDYFSL